MSWLTSTHILWGFDLIAAIFAGFMLFSWRRRYKEAGPKMKEFPPPIHETCDHRHYEGECAHQEDILVVLQRELEQRREPVLVDILQRAILEITDLREDLEVRLHQEEQLNNDSR